MEVVILKSSTIMKLSGYIEHLNVQYKLYRFNGAWHKNPISATFEEIKHARPRDLTVFLCFWHDCALHRPPLALRGERPPDCVFMQDTKLARHGV